MEKKKAIGLEKKQRAKQRRDTVLTRIDRQLRDMVKNASRVQRKTMSRINDEAIRFYFKHIKANI